MFTPYEKRVASTNLPFLNSVLKFPKNGSDHNPWICLDTNRMEIIISSTIWLFLLILYCILHIKPANILSNACLLVKMDSGMRELVASSSLSTCRRFHTYSLGGLGDVKALVVDDNRINQMLHHKLLDNLGIENQVVCNGKEAVDIHVLGKQFDLILMDIDMPVMNGIEATRKLRDMGIRSIITGVSSHTLDHVKKEFMEAGIDEYHEKPLTSARLLSILNKIKHKD